MSTINISLEEAQERFPDEVEQVVSALRNSKSKKKAAPIEDIQFSIFWVCMVKSRTAADLFAGSRPKQDPFEQRVRASLQGKVGRWFDTSDRILPCPQEILDQQAQGEADRAAEQKRIAGLSPEENEKEIESLLGQLRGPGFMEIRRK